MAKDYYDIGPYKWQVTDEAVQCVVCGAMSFVLSNRLGGYCCIGCADDYGNQMKVAEAARRGKVEAA